MADTNDDVCTCGRCDISTCDQCDAPVAFVDADGEAWCDACYAAYARAQELVRRDAELEDCDVRFPVRRHRMTRAERLQGLADRGIDTWDEYDERI